MRFCSEFERLFCGGKGQKAVLARRLGVSLTYISNVCSGASVPATVFVAQCCDIFGVEHGERFALFGLLLTARGGLVMVSTAGLGHLEREVLIESCISSFSRASGCSLA